MHALCGTAGHLQCQPHPVTRPPEGTEEAVRSCLAVLYALLTMVRVHQRALSLCAACH